VVKSGLCTWAYILISETKKGCAKASLIYPYTMFCNCRVMNRIRYREPLIATISGNRRELSLQSSKKRTWQMAIPASPKEILKCGTLAKKILFGLRSFPEERRTPESCFVLSSSEQGFARIGVPIRFRTHRRVGHQIIAMRKLIFSRERNELAHAFCQAHVDIPGRGLAYLSACACICRR
jgi:hypothetical protein